MQHGGRVGKTRRRQMSELWGGARLASIHPVSRTARGGADASQGQRVGVVLIASIRAADQAAPFLLDPGDQLGDRAVGKFASEYELVGMAARAGAYPGKVGTGFPKRICATQED